MDASIISAIATGVLAAIVTGLFTKNIADKKHSIENITQERKKWRDEMREATLAVRCLSEHCHNQRPNKIWLFINMCGWLRHPFLLTFA